MDRCWVWLKAKNEKGYGVLRAGSGNMLAHRASWEAVNGPIPKGVCVLHRCDNPACVNPEHLFLGTRADNNSDMAAKNRNARGQVHGRAKLTADQVREIRSITGETQRSIAKRFSVAASMVSRIVTRRNWRCV